MIYINRFINYVHNYFEKLNYPLFFILLFILFKPEGLVNYGTFNDMLNLFRIIISLFIFVVSLKNVKMINNDFIILLGCIQILLIITTFLQNENLFSIVKTSILILSSVLLINIINLSSHKNKYYKYMGITFAIFIIINLVTLSTDIFGYDSNGNVMHFLGIDNQILINLIVFLIFIFYYDYLSFKKLSFISIISYFCTLLTVFITWSASALLGFFVFSLGVLLFIFKIKYNNKFFWLLLVLYISIYFLIIIFRFQNYFSFIIEDILHKNLTFSGRIYIWDAAFNAISKKPIFGYGETYIPVVYALNYHLGPHNQILQFLIQGGIVSLLLNFILFIKVGLKLNKKEKNSFFWLLLFSLGGIFISMLMESYDQIFLYYMLLYFIYQFNLSKIRGEKYDT